MAAVKIWRNVESGRRWRRRLAREREAALDKVMLGMNCQNCNAFIALPVPRDPGDMVPVEQLERVAQPEACPGCGTHFTVYYWARRDA